MSSITLLPIKVEYKGVLRRLRLSSPSFGELMKNILALFPALQEANLWLKYYDGEDYVTVGSDVELVEGFAVAGADNQKTLRLLVTEGLRPAQLLALSLQPSVFAPRSTSITDAILVEARFEGQSSSHEVRRFTIGLESSLPALRAEIEHNYADLLTGLSYLLKYLDDEDDRVTLSSEADLREAIRITRKTPDSCLIIIIIRENRDGPTGVNDASPANPSCLPSTVSASPTSVSVGIAQDPKH